MKMSGVIGLALLATVWTLPAGAATVNGSVVNAGANVTQDGITGTGFFIPNTGSSNLTYGVSGAGQSTSNSAFQSCSSGCSNLTMQVHFTGLQAGVAGVLTLNFSDLDIIPLNDNGSSLSETIKIVANGNTITGVSGGILKNITTQTPSGNGNLTATGVLTTGGKVTGNDNTQTITLNLTGNLITASTFDLFLTFQSFDTGFFADNSKEVVNASIAQVSAVPLPATLPLFASGLGALALLARRRKQKQLAA